MAAKTQAQAYIDRGFSREMFAQESDNAFVAFLTGIIDEQSGLLAGEVGSAAFASVDPATVVAVTRAERLMVMAELLAARIDVVQGAVDGADGMDNLKLRRNIETYRAEAARIIERLLSGLLAASTGYSGCVVESEHPVTLAAP